jgi:hypothetical protein
VVTDDIDRAIGVQYQDEDLSPSGRCRSSSTRLSPHGGKKSDPSWRAGTCCDDVAGHATRAISDRYNIVNERDLAEAGQRLQQYIGRQTTEHAE